MPSRGNSDVAAIEERLARQRAEAGAQDPVIEEPEAIAGLASATPRTAGPTAIQEYRDLSEEFDSRDVALPRVKLAQPISKVVVDDVVRSGHWYYSVDNTDLGPMLRFVPLKAFKHRTFFLDNGLACRSTDMVHGIGDPGIECAKCSLKDWPEQRGSGGPQCRENYNFPSVILPNEGDDEEFFRMGLITLTSTSTAAARTLLGMAFQRGAQRDPLAWAEHIYTLTAIKRQNARGIFYVASIAYDSKNSGDVLEFARLQCESMRKVSVTELVAEDAE